MSTTPSWSDVLTSSMRLMQLFSSQHGLGRLHGPAHREVLQRGLPRDGGECCCAQVMIKVLLEGILR